MGRLVYVNGELVPAGEATVSVFDHGLLYGDGVFEGIRIYHGRVFRLERHTRRLFEGATVLRLDIPLTPEEMNDAIRRTVEANGLTEGYIRVVITRGVGTLGLNPQLCEKPQVIIIADTITLYPEECYRDGLTVITASTVRNHPNALNPRIKSLNYLNNILAKIEAIDAGVPEAIMLNHEGLVAEATGDNIFIVRDRIVRTPPISSGLLEGVTRHEVIDICREAGWDLREEELSRYDLYAAEECFLTGTAAEVIPVTHIDRRTVGDGKPGQVTRDILAKFRERIGQGA